MNSSRMEKSDIFKILVGVISTLLLVITSFVFGTSMNNRGRIECIEKDIVEVRTQAGYSQKNYELLRLEVLDQLKDVKEEVKKINATIIEVEKKVVLLNNKTSNR